MSRNEDMTNTKKLRAMVAPIPKPNYPTPWRTAERQGPHRTVVCADGCYTAECPSDGAADIIVAAVNEFAARSPVADRHGVEDVISSCFWGSPLAGDGLELARKIRKSLAEAGYTVVGPDSE